METENMINNKWEGRCVANLTKDSLPMRRFEGCVAFERLDSSGNSLSFCFYTVQRDNSPLSFPELSKTISRGNPQIRTYFQAISQPLSHYNEISHCLFSGQVINGDVYKDPGM